MAWHVEEGECNQSTRCPLGIVGHLLCNGGFEGGATAAGEYSNKRNSLVDSLAPSAVTAASPKACRLGPYACSDSQHPQTPSKSEPPSGDSQMVLLEPTLC